MPQGDSSYGSRPPSRPSNRGPGGSRGGYSGGRPTGGPGGHSGGPRSPKPGFSPRGPGGPRTNARPPRRMPEGLEILEQKGGLIIFDKPTGLADDARGMSLIRSAQDFLGPRSGPELLTRLEQSASGIVVVAEQGRFAAQFRKSFYPNKAQRFYMAVVEGTPPAETGTINAQLRLGTRGVIETVPEGDGTITTETRHAVSHYRLLGSGNGLSLIRVRAETDYEGQLRAHLASIGCPIIGDRSFNATRNDLSRLGLHLGELHFDPPGGKVTARLKSPVPAEFWTLCELEPPAHARPMGKPLERPRVSEPEAPAADVDESDEADQGWEHVAGWYDDLLSERRSDHHDKVVHPGVIKLLDPRSGERVLDVACGQGELCRQLSLVHTGGEELSVLGIDASPTLIQSAIDRSAERLEFKVADARSLDESFGEFDAATCVLALMNIDDLGGSMAAIAERLKMGGRFIAVVMHPAFRVSGASDWDFDDWKRDPTQFRRIAAYLTPKADQIVMNPGAVSKGADPITTTTHHRPIGQYVAACAKAGLMVDTLEEWASQRISEDGPRAEAENRARREIPMFLAFRAVKTRAADAAPEIADAAPESIDAPSDEIANSEPATDTPIEPTPTDPAAIEPEDSADPS
ncbi:MAG: 23S rRNA-/tRNA-specific pseudouridylate synthase/ubiquinone [Phycisphaerales bacterium]|jgi:23S rRNA-/tRNA-specific pseudouridylate synthase/ubiquinone/menaquinone biosynthesis C-methylase UbiE